MLLNVSPRTKRIRVLGNSARCLQRSKHQVEDQGGEGRQRRQVVGDPARQQRQGSQALLNVAEDRRARRFWIWSILVVPAIKVKEFRFGKGEDDEEKRAKRG